MKRRLMALAMIGLPSIAISSLPPSASAQVSPTASVTGVVSYASGTSFTIQTAGRRTGVVDALTTAADGITRHDYPYVWAGGHGQAGVASIGSHGPGHNGRRIGFDCSGAVAAVLAAGGLWTPGSGVPNDAGIVAQLRGEGLIARGVGAGPVQVTLYDRPGVHIFMNVDGRFFGTSDGVGGGDPRGGAGWLDDGAPDASSSSFKAYHVIAAALRGSASTGHIVSFQLGALPNLMVGLEVGENVQVGYRELTSGSLVAASVAFPGATTVDGTVQSIATDGSSFTIQTADGKVLTFATANDPGLAQAIALGDTVQVTYTTSTGSSTVRALTVTAASSASSGTAGVGDGSVGNPGYGAGPNNGPSQ